MSDEQSEAEQDGTPFEDDVTAHPDVSADAVVTDDARSLAVDPTTRRARLALGVIAVFVAGLIIGRLSSGSGDGSETTTAEAAPTALEFPAGDVDRTGYWGFVALEPVVIDTFDRADDPQSLGTTGTDQDWDPVAGAWGISDNSAYSPGGSGGGTRLAVVADGRGDGLIEVTMTVVEAGAGLAFNYVDPENYWSVTANPSAGSWSVSRVVGGQVESMGEMAGSTANGTTISVEQKGTNVRFILDGDEALAIPEAARADHLQGGLIAAADASGAARWDRFLAMVYQDEPTTTAPE